MISNEKINVVEDKNISLEKGNVQLRKKQSDDSESKINLSQYKVNLHFIESQPVVTSSTQPPLEVDAVMSLEEIFRHISVRISGCISSRQFVEEMSSLKKDYFVDTQQALIVKCQLVSLGVLEEVDVGREVYVRLSEIGKKEMQQLNAPRAE